MNVPPLVRSGQFLRGKRRFEIGQIGEQWVGTVKFGTTDFDMWAHIIFLGAMSSAEKLSCRKQCHFLTVSNMSIVGVV